MSSSVSLRREGVGKWPGRAAIALALLSIPVIFDYSRSTIVNPTWLYTACGLLGVSAIVVGIRIHRPVRAFPWYLMAVGNLLFVAGDVIYWRLNAAGVPPFPGYNDFCYLFGYLFLAVGFATLVGASGRARGSFIDASIIATSLGLIGWVFLMEPYAVDRSLTMPQRLVSVAYPVVALILLATVCWGLFNGGRRNRSVNWLLLSTAALLIGVTIYGVLVLEGSYSGGWTDAGFIISYLTFGAAALDPSMKSLIPRTEQRTATVSRRRLVLLATAAALGPGLLAYTAFRHTEVDHWVMSVGMLVLFLLTFARMAGLMRSIERDASLLEAQGRDLSTAVDDLKGLEEARRRLLDAVHTTAEKERSSLAVDLHDGPIQHLATLSFEVDLVGLALEKGDDAGVHEALETLEAGLSDEVASLRRLMTDLRPPVLDERGLVQALKDYVAAFIIRTDIACDLEIDIYSRLESETETILYRITQEALSNVAKHSYATRVLVQCSATETDVELEVTDDGVGFDVQATDTSGSDGHLGLASIKERIGFAGGTYSIDAGVGRGTRLQICLGRGRVRDEEVARTAG